MKTNAKLMVALLTATMAFGAVGCKGEPPVPPKDFDVSDTTTNNAEISIKSFVITEPDFLDNEGRSARPAEGQEKVAILSLRVKNNSGSEMKYKPLHTEGVKNRIQLCTDPDPETGARVNFKAISFANGGYHTAGQLIATTTIPANGEIVDEYLFEPPVTSEDKLVVLVPGAIVGDSSPRVLRYYVRLPNDVPRPEPITLKKPNTIDDLSVTVTKVAEEYYELVPRVAPKDPLKYAYAYTDKPVMAVYVTIENKGSEARSYDPSHTSESNGVNMFFAGGANQRIKLPADVYGKDQITGKISIKPGETKKDVYLFEAPTSDGPLEFKLSGHIFSVRGLYRFNLNFSHVANLSKPDLEPWKKDEAAAEGDDAVEEKEEKKDAKK